MSRIQGFRMPGTVSSMDWNYNNRFFLAGGKQAIKIIEFSTEKQYWFEIKKTINKHKGAPMTKVCVSQLAWNKAGSDLVAVGTTSGFVTVYDVQQNSPKSIFSVKGHDGNIKNILWVPEQRDIFISSSYENEINIWDIRQPQTAKTIKIEYPDVIKIRDIKFNPNDNNIFGVQCSSAIKIVDYRNPTVDIVSKHIKDNQLQGYMMQWDPHDKYRLASGVSKEINILQWDGDDLKFQQSLSHYSLIKAFKWLSHKKNFFGISGENPQKNICFYDLADKDRVCHMYAGHSKSIDCWMMDDAEKIILSASNAKQKSTTASNMKSNYGQIVAQYSDNFIDPNQTRFEHPLAFDNNSSLAFTLSITDPQAPSQQKNSRRYRYSFPTVYLQEEQNKNFQFSTIKEELIFFHTHYLYQGKNQVIAQNNSAVALKCNKGMVADFWKVLFVLAYPEDIKEPTLEAIYESKVKADITFLENRIILNSRSSLKLQHKRLNINTLIQHLADQNQLQTAVIASIILLNKSPELISEQTFAQIVQPYMQILRNLELYTIASETLLMLSKFEEFSNTTTKNTQYRITCGWCKESVTKGECKCNLLCVLCQERLNDRMVIWCKYCGHGGHAQEYKKWFEENTTCPHGCEHQCFRPQDFY